MSIGPPSIIDLMKWTLLAIAEGKADSGPETAKPVDPIVAGEPLLSWAEHMHWAESRSASAPPAAARRLRTLELEAQAARRSSNMVDPSL
jgi:hypothetical protein